MADTGYPLFGHYVPHKAFSFILQGNNKTRPVHVCLGLNEKELHILKIGKESKKLLDIIFLGFFLDSGLYHELERNYFGLFVSLHFTTSDISI